MFRLSFGLLLIGAACDGEGPPVLGGDGGLDDGAPGDASTDAAFDAGTDATVATCDEPGTTERVACGACGEAIRFCTIDGVWEQGPCEDEVGECTPGDTEMSSCGSCGTQTTICNASCAWESAGECMEMGECEPGARQRTPDGCESGQTRELLCSDSCVFEESMACESDECEDPGTVETIECGRCGTAERFCTSAHVWEYGPCGGEGVCDPGTSEEVSCGNCGTRLARCNTSCEWAETGACTDEGECAPGSMRTTTDGCDPGEARLETCNAECSYTAGMCVEAPGVDVMILLDMTGSHAWQVTAASTAFGDFAEDVLDITDAQVGVAYYADFPVPDYGSTGDKPFVAGRRLGTNLAAIRSELDSAPTMMGNDGPESGVEALYILAGGTAHPMAEPFACGGGCWRPATTRIVVLFTDAAQHNGPALTGSGMHSPYTGVTPAPVRWGAARTQLLESGIRLIVVTTGGDARTQHERILDELGEDASVMHFTRSGDSFDVVLDEVLAQIETLAD